MRSSILPSRELASEQKDVDLEIEPGEQHFLEAHHARSAGGVEHVEVEREADFEVGQAVEALEQQIGVDGAGTRLEHDPQVLLAFVPYVGENGQLLVGDELRDLLDQLGFRDPVRNFADQQIPAPALLALDLDFGAKRKAPRPLT